MTRKILMNDYHVLPNAIVGGNFWVLNWWLNQIERWKNIFEDFSKWRREETWLTFLHLTHTWLIDFLLKKACAMGLITVSVSSQWKASTCLPCISLCKSCVVLFVLSGCTFSKDIITQLVPHLPVPFPSPK